MFYQIYADLCYQINKTPSKVANEIGIEKSAVTYWRKNENALPKENTIRKIAEYFGVSVDYLKGKTDSQNLPEQYQIENFAKVALFGGNTEVTAEMWDDVKQYVEFVKMKYKKD